MLCKKSRCKQRPRFHWKTQVCTPSHLATDFLPIFKGSVKDPIISPKSGWIRVCRWNVYHGLTSTAKSELSCSFCMPVQHSWFVSSEILIWAQNATRKNKNTMCFHLFSEGEHFIFSEGEEISQLDSISLFSQKCH